MKQEKLRRLSCAAAFLSVVTGACSTTVPREYSVDPSAFRIHHYYTEPAERQVYKLSPFGTKLAALEKSGRTINIQVTDLATGERGQATNFSAVSVTGFAWANENRILLHGPYELAILTVNADGGQGRVFADAEYFCAEACDDRHDQLYFLDYMQAIDPLTDDPNHILVAKNSLGPGAFLPEAYRIHVVTGELELVNSGPAAPFLDRWFTDLDGGVIGGELETKTGRTILLVNPASGEWKELFRAPRDQLRFTPIAVSPVDRQGYAVTDRAPDGSVRDHTGLYHFDFAAGQHGALLLEVPGADCCEVLVSPVSESLISASYGTGADEKTVYLEPRIREHMEALEVKLAGRNPRITSMDAAEDRAVIMATAADGGRDYYLYDFQQRSLSLLADSPRIVDLVEDHREPMEYAWIPEKSSGGFRGGFADMSRSSSRPSRGVDSAGIVARMPARGGN